MVYDRTMITMTESALKKAIEIAGAEGLSRRIRLKVIGGGCSGFQYDMFFDDNEPTDFDEVFEAGNEIKLVVDPLSIQYLDGMEIDFVSSLQGEGFKFINPNVKSTCGCGSSFSA